MTWNNKVKTFLSCWANVYPTFFSYIIFQNCMWTEALTWLKWTNPCGNSKSTWGLWPHNITSITGDLAEVWVSRQARFAGSENRNLLIQTFSFSFLKSLILVQMLEVGLRFLGISWVLNSKDVPCHCRSQFPSPNIWPLLDHMQEQVCLWDSPRLSKVDSD